MPRPTALWSLATALALFLAAPVCRAAGESLADASLPLRGVGNVPVLGFGCGGRKQEALLTAIQAGYRLFDTALWPDWGYWQQDLAAAIAASGLPREDFIIESKVAPIDFGKVATLRAIERTLSELNTSYVDVLITHHMACTESAMCWSDWNQAWRPSNWMPDGDVSAAYSAMEDAVLAGKARAIGFSNIDVPTLTAVLGMPLRVKPAFISNAFNAFHQDKGVRALCEEHGILYQGFLLMGRNNELSHPVFGQIAASHGVSPAQVALRWALTKNVTVLASSGHPERVRQNRQLDFALSKEELESIDALDGTQWPLLASDRASMIQIGPHSAAPSG